MNKLRFKIIAVAFSAFTWAYILPNNKACSFTVKIDFIRNQILGCGAHLKVGTSEFDILYRFSIDGGHHYQDDPNFFFDADRLPATINIFAKNRITGEACAYPQNPVTINKGAIQIQSITWDSIICNGNTTTVTVKAVAYDVLGVLIPLQYNIDGGAYQSSNTFSHVSGGNHTICVSYERLLHERCTVCQSITIPQPSQITITTSYEPITCNGDLTTVTVTAHGGVAPYQYNLDGSPFSPSNIFTGVAAGNHAIGVRDSLGCVKYFPVTIAEPTKVTFTVTTTPVSCFGFSDGSIKINAAGGVPPYRAIINGEVSAPFDQTFTKNNLPAGTYIIEVRDHNGCSAQAPYTAIIGTPTEVAFTAVPVPVSCFGHSDGSITITASGGTPPYKAIINGQEYGPFNPTFTKNDLPVGSYTIAVQDYAGCSSVSETVEITQPTEIKIYASATQVSCMGAHDGTITVKAVGGTPPYLYSIDGIIYSPENTFNHLAAGRYTVYVKDSHNCIATSSVLVPLYKLAFMSSLSHGAPVQSVAWLCDDNCPILAAIGGYKALNAHCSYTSIRAYTFDQSKESLNEITIDMPLPSDYIYSVDWCCINGIPFLAVAGCPDIYGNSVWIYRFDASYNQMIFVQSFKHNGIIFSVKWLCDECILAYDSRYLAIGGEPVDGIDTRLLSFSPDGTLTSVADASHGATVYTVDWCTLNQQCPLLITGGQTTINYNMPLNIRMYAVSCSGIMTLITSSYFEGKTVRSIAAQCARGAMCKAVAYVLVTGDPIPDGPHKTSNAILYYFNHRTAHLFPLAYIQQQEKVFASMWITGFDCPILALGSSCEMNGLCNPNIGLYSIECDKVPQLIQTGKKKHDDNITSLASCKIGKFSYILAGSERANWQPNQQLDPLCSLHLFDKEVALFKGNFCTPCQQSCTPTPICDRTAKELNP